TEYPAAGIDGRADVVLVLDVHVVAYHGKAAGNEGLPCAAPAEAIMRIDTEILLVEIRTTALAALEDESRHARFEKEAGIERKTVDEARAKTVAVDATQVVGPCVVEFERNVTVVAGRCHFTCGEYKTCEDQCEQRGGMRGHSVSPGVRCRGSFGCRITRQNPFCRDAGQCSDPCIRG